MSYKVCLLGCALFTGNRGVSALGVALVKIIRTIYPDAEFYFLVGGKESMEYDIDTGSEKVKVREVVFRLSPKGKVSEHLFYLYFNAIVYRCLPIPFIKKMILKRVPWLKLLKQADFVGDIRGGDSFSDIYGVKRFFFGSLPDRIAQLMTRNFVYLPQTYGPYYSAYAKRNSTKLMKKSKKIFCRDDESIEFLKAKLKRQKDVDKLRFCPDVAFMLDPIRPKEVKILPDLTYLKKKKKLIGLNISGLLYRGGFNEKNMFNLSLNYKEFIDKLIVLFGEMDDINVLLTPHTYVIHPDQNIENNIENDYIVSRDIYNELNGKSLFLVNENYNQSEIKSLIGDCDFFIGSRMHACIAAISQGIPTNGISYSRKFIGVFNTVGLGNFVIDANVLSTDEAIRRVIEHLSKESGKQDYIKKNVTGAQKTIMDVFREELKT